MPILHTCAVPIEPIIGGTDDVFATCCSYEDRTLGVVESLSPYYRTRHAAVFVSREYADKGNAPSHLARIQERLSEAMTTKCEVIKFEIDRPLASMREFEAMCGQWAGMHPLNWVTLDISTFPRQEMLVLLRVLDKTVGLSRVRLLYTAPMKYGSEEVGGWLTRGVKAVRAVPGFGGIQPPGKAKLLVILLGHEEERAAITWKRHQPRKCVVVLPTPGYRPELTETVEGRHSLLFSMLAASTTRIGIPAHGIRETRDLILRLWEEHKATHYLVVAPLGTKLQTLGVFEAVRLQSAIQVTYAVPAIYNHQMFSQKTGKLWQVKMGDR